MSMLDVNAVEAYFKQLQDDITHGISELDGKSFVEDAWHYETGGGGRSRVLAGGNIIEKGGVNFSHVKGTALPPSATKKRPELAGRGFSAMGVSLVLHPHNPFAPTSHMNVRFFNAPSDSGESIWWFGGGFDLTPSYGFLEDAVHWHETALAACAPFGETAYDRYKAGCDEYFYLPHRDETRGVGGLFFDDLNQPSFAASFEFTQSVGNHFLPAYLPILERRHDMPFTDEHKGWQRIRRGRYVEFNLVYDRGTLFGLQSGGRTESILMSMPPQAQWEYQHRPQAGSPEAALLSDFLGARDWLSRQSKPDDLADA